MTLYMRKDFLAVKAGELAVLQARSQSALDMVTRTIETLSRANAQISSIREEIADYQEKLKNEDQNLLATAEKNAHIIENFSALIGE